MRTIRGKIMVTVLTISLISLFLLAAVSIVNLLSLRGSIITMSDELGHSAASDSGAAIEAQVSEQLTLLARAKADVADEKLGKQQIYVQMMADYLTGLYGAAEQYAPLTVAPPDPEKAGEFTAQLVLSPEAEANFSAVADELGLVSNAAAIFLAIPTHDSDIQSNYFSTASGLNVMIDDISDHKPPNLDATTRGWYQAAVSSGGLIWTDVFDDTMGRGLAITCAAPFFDPNTGETMGVVGFGSLITPMAAAILDTKIGQSGYAFVVNEQGQTIISPNIQKDAEGKIIRESLLDDSNPTIRALGESILRGENGVTRAEYQGREVFLAYEPMEVLPWTVVTVMDVEEALAPAYTTREQITNLTSRTVSDVDISIRQVIVAMLVVLIAAAVAVAVSSAVLAGRLTRPLSTLTAHAGRISGGDLDAQIDLKTGDEIQTLADAFNGMTASLKQYIRDLTSVTAEKERIGAELNVATQIQKDMLPNIFPAFPERREFDIYASMDPAKEVGGDFYDFFMVDDSHLAVVMADVSGKGVPAALFMVIAKTIIKNQALTGDPLDQVFDRANDQLCENNGEGLFVTAFMGLLDLNTGDFTYVNAGHNAPLLRRKGGDYEYLQMEPGFVLAGLDGMVYEDSHLKLDEGDTLFLYTDGVTEALDPNEELFGEERLKAALNNEQGKDLQVSKLLPYVRSTLETFARGAEQADDITMLGITYRGPGKEGNA